MAVKEKTAYGCTLFDICGKVECKWVAYCRIKLRNKDKSRFNACTNKFIGIDTLCEREEKECLKNGN